MSADTLSDLLRVVRLRGAIFYDVEGEEPWVAEAPAAKTILHLIMPSSEHMIEFHGVARGSCWAAIAGETPVRLEEGDLVIFPQGDPHVISSAPGMRVTPVPMELYDTPKPEQLPFLLHVRGKQVRSVSQAAHAAADTKLVCGFLGCDATPFNPLLASLPRVLRMPAVAADGSAWIAQFLHTAADESARRRPGGEAVLERMSEMMFVEVLRRYVDGLDPEQKGWLSGLRDPGVGRALAVIHEHPAAPWTLEGLAEKAAMSRSTLAERFTHFIGQPPMQYLAKWRMQLAAGMLRDSDAKLIEIAYDVGYENESAFSRAFKREVGQSPGQWRRSHRRKVEKPGTRRKKD